MKILKYRYVSLMTRSCLGGWGWLGVKLKTHIKHHVKYVLKVYAEDKIHAMIETHSCRYQMHCTSQRLHVYFNYAKDWKSIEHEKQAKVTVCARIVCKGQWLCMVQHSQLLLLWKKKHFNVNPWQSNIKAILTQSLGVSACSKSIHV